MRGPRLLSGTQSEPKVQSFGPAIDPCAPSLQRRDVKAAVLDPATTMEGTLRSFIAPAAAFLAALLVLPFNAPRTEAATEAIVTLNWTAPGDDGTIGAATQYDLRYSTSPITDANFLSATKMLNMPFPAAAGTKQSVSISGLNINTTYYFAIKSSDERGNWSAMSNVAVRTVNGAVGVGDENVTLRFTAPYPNPCRDRASFSIGVPTAADVSIEAFDISGRHVRTLARGNHAAGAGTLVWDLRDDEGHALGTGVYLVRARIGDQSFNRRVIIER